MNAAINMREITPSQVSGTAIDAESRREFANDKIAQLFFEKAQQRLQNVSRWNTLAGGISAFFWLINGDGDSITRAPLSGDYIMIDIPGPGTKAGKGYDWVRVEEILLEVSENQEAYGFRVRPVPNPFGIQEDTAHFYSQRSTSTFLVSRERNTVSAQVHDRNIEPNQNANNVVDKVRNAVVGATGALMFSKIQWQKLTDGLLRD